MTQAALSLGGERITGNSRERPSASLLCFFLLRFQAIRSALKMVSWSYLFPNFDASFCFCCCLSVLAATAIANIVRTSLGPLGLDKMMVDDIGVSLPSTIDFDLHANDSLSRMSLSPTMALQF